MDELGRNDRCQKEDANNPVKKTGNNVTASSVHLNNKSATTTSTRIIGNANPFVTTTGIRINNIIGRSNNLFSPENKTKK